MELCLWPSANPKADALLRAFFDRVSPGWGLRPGWVEIDGGEILERLWPLIDASAIEGRVEPLAEEIVDARMEAIAAGAALRFDDLEHVAKVVLQARLMVALSGATGAMLSPGPVIRLPRGLTGDQTTTALALRALYQAPLSIEGLQ